MNHHREHHKGNNEHFNKHAGHNIQMFARKFWVSLVLTIPVVLYSELPEKLFGIRIPAFSGSEYFSLILGTAVFFYGGWVFIIGGIREIKNKLPGMMTLITLAISAAYLYSVYAAVFKIGEPLFWELTTLITVMLLGHWLEMKAVLGTQSALKELSKLLPDTAEIVRAGKTEIIKIEELKIGDVILVRPGGKIPADGMVVSGKSDVNESLATGESKPVEKNTGSEVIAGTINGDGSLQVKVTKIGENTFLAGVMRLVAEAQASKSRLQILSDRAAFYLTIIAIFSGALTFILWIFIRGDFPFALERMVTVLVIACPHALGLAVPLVASVSTMLAAKNGFLVRERLALEQARSINVILFDKTGTLTRGEFGVSKIIVNQEFNISENEVLKYAASVDKFAEHFIAKAIVKEAERRNLKLFSAENFEAMRGKGAKALVENKEVLIGGDILLRENDIPFPKILKSQSDILAREGKTVIYVIVRGKIMGAIALSDIIRDESKEAVKKLKEMEIEVAMITGDSEDVAKWAAKELGIDKYFARVLPDEKSQIIKKIQEENIGYWKLEIGNYRQRRVVAMVGDGINDAPALVQADLGIAVGAGTNVAIESAGIILVRNDPRDIVKIIKLSKATYRKMIQNIFWASGYNIIAIPLAAGALYYYGILLAPAIGAIFMSLSTVIVSINALLLKKIKL